MGRKKKYDRNNLVVKAMNIFRDHGYAGTSTQMLVDGLGINRFTLYAEFGNKQQLFEAALDHYNNEVVARRFGPLQTSTSGIEEIRALLAFYATAGEGPAAGRGCLLCNTAVEFGPVDPGDAGFVERYLAYLSEAFFRALKNAQGRGELKSDVALQVEADFFTASTLGLFVMIRAKAPAAVIENAAKTAIAHLDGLLLQEEKAARNDRPSS